MGPLLSNNYSSSKIEKSNIYDTFKYLWTKIFSLSWLQHIIRNLVWRSNANVPCKLNKTSFRPILPLKGPILSGLSDFRVLLILGDLLHNIDVEIWWKSGETSKIGYQGLHSIWLIQKNMLVWAHFWATTTQFSNSSSSKHSSTAHSWTV